MPAPSIRDTKNGTDRIVDLPPRAVAELASLPYRTGRVFRHRGGKSYRATDDSKGESYGGQNRGVWHSARVRGGIDRRVTPHAVRHTWATWHYAVYRDPMKLREDGGWKTISQVERYAKLAPQGLVPEILLNGYPLHSRSPQCWGWIAGGNDLMVGCRSYGNGLLGEAMEEQPAGLGTSAIEAEGEFVEVVVEMLVLDAALMGSHQPSLKQRRQRYERGA